MWVPYRTHNGHCGEPVSGNTATDGALSYNAGVVHEFGMTDSQHRHASRGLAHAPACLQQRRQVRPSRAAGDSVANHVHLFGG